MFDLLTNPVTLSVITMCALCLVRINVLFSLIIATIVAGLTSGMSLDKTFSLLVSGMGNNSETALSYILLGTFAAALTHIGISDNVGKWLSKTIRGNRFILFALFAIMGVLSQTLIPIHIAFIPILIPALLVGMNRMKCDRRGAACALAFGLKAPYITLPIGYGLIFQKLVADNMTTNGLETTVPDVFMPALILGGSLLLGLILSMIYYRKDRSYGELITSGPEGFASTEGSQVAVAAEPAPAPASTKAEWFRGHSYLVAGVALVVMTVLQLRYHSMPLGAISGLAILVLGGSLRIKESDNSLSEGIKLMGTIAFIMLIAAGMANVVNESGAVPKLVEIAQSSFAGNQFMAAVVMILIGLIITMGIGTSFGTVPILAVLYVPLAQSLGFSQPSTIILIIAAAALGDAGSPASDTTLGPTSGLNADGKHDHIWDTCLPTFLFYNIPLIIFGVIGAILLSK